MRKKSQVMVSTVLVVCFLACYTLIVWLNQNTQRRIAFMGVDMDVSSICGVILVLQIGLSVLLLCMNYQMGFIIATILQCIMLSSTLMVTILFRNPNNVPGVAMAFGGILIVILIHRQFQLIEESRSQYRELSYTDSLTLLPNRRGMLKFMENKMEEGDPFYLLFIDLDNFKTINDTMGHKFGDKVLYETGRRWNKLIEEKGFLARNSGDEFVMLIPGKDKAQIVEFMQKCLDILSEAVVIDHYTYYATASIGAAVFPDDTRDSNQLFQYADTAMYCAKKDFLSFPSILATR